MMLLALENHRTGYVWEVCSKIPAVQRGTAAAGFRVTSERDETTPLKSI
jgi:hypothetical protein